MTARTHTDRDKGWEYLFDLLEMFDGVLGPDDLCVGHGRQHLEARVCEQLTHYVHVCVHRHGPPGRQRRVLRVHQRQRLVRLMLLRVTTGKLHKRHETEQGATPV